MKRLLPLLILLAVPAAAPALAQEQVYRLSEAEKQAAIEAASRQPEQTTRLPIVSGRAPGTPDNKVHGEVGMMIGTGGARALWGTTAIPLGENGSAQFSFNTSRFNNFGGGYFPNQYADGSFPLTSGGSPFAVSRNPYGNPYGPGGFRPF